MFEFLGVAPMEVRIHGVTLGPQTKASVYRSTKLLSWSISSNSSSARVWWQTVEQTHSMKHSASWQA